MVEKWRISALSRAFEKKGKEDEFTHTPATES